MTRDAGRRAFTLVEALIILIILGVLVATVVPQFSSAAAEAKHSALRFNLHTMRQQIEVYKTQHAGRVPALARFADQMTRPTDIDGATTGPDLIFGPYFQGQIPANPFSGSSVLVGVAKWGVEPSGPRAGGAGWQYDQSTGVIYPNNPEYYR